MNTVSIYSRQLMAFAAALMITGTLTVNALAVSPRQVHSVAGILA